MATGSTQTKLLWGYATANSMLCVLPERRRHNALRTRGLPTPFTLHLLSGSQIRLSAHKPIKTIRYLPVKDRMKKVRFSVSREHTFIQILALKSNIMLTCHVFFLEWHFVLKALTTFTSIQPKRKHLWDVKIAFGEKTESEQEHRKQPAKIYSKYYTSSKMF